MGHGIPSIPFAGPAQIDAPAPRAQAGESAVFDNLTDGRLEQFLRGGSDTAAGAVVTPHSALSAATAYRCTALICGAVANMPLDLKRREGRDRLDADDHALWPVLKRKPNAWQTPAQFRRYMQACVLLRKGGFAHIVRSGRRIVALHPLDPDRVEVIQNGDLSLTFQYTRADGGIINFEQRDIFYLCGLSLDGVRSLSVLSYARETLGEALATAAHARTLFKNGTSIGGVLQAPNKISPEHQAQLKQSLEDYRGAANAHKNLILQDGMTYNRLGLSLVDAQFIQNRELSQLEIAMFFGVPPHMLGLTQKTTSWGSGIEQQSQGFVTYTLQDWLTMWAEAIDRDLIGAEPKLYSRFNTKGLVRGDIKTRFGAYAVGRQWGWLSANDVRELEDENPITGGDTYYTPANMNPAGDPPPGDREPPEDIPDDER